MTNHEQDSQVYQCEPSTSGSWQTITGRQSEVGGITVSRTLPTRNRRMIGPWVFLDHLGPVRFSAGQQGLQVGPHPHTCLQTFTWMLQGQIRHRDSLGSDQILRPGEVNLMTAGWGIAHTEESVPAKHAIDLESLQLWLAMPASQAAAAPDFQHYAQLPVLLQHGWQGQVLLGEFSGQQAPGQAYTPTVAVDWQLPASSTGVLPLNPAFEYGVYVISGRVQLDHQPLAARTLGYLPPGQQQVELQALEESRVLLLGGAPFSEPVTLWWNYVGHSKAYISAAQADWERGSGRFGEIPNPVAEPMAGPPVPWAPQK